MRSLSVFLKNTMIMTKFLWNADSIFSPINSKTYKSSDISLVKGFDLNSEPLTNAVRIDCPDVSRTESLVSRVPSPNQALLVILALSQSYSACNALHLYCHSLSLTPKLSTPVFRSFTSIRGDQIQQIYHHYLWQQHLYEPY